MSHKMVKKAIKDAKFRKLLLDDPNKALKSLVPKSELKEATRVAKVVAKVRGQSPQKAMAVLRTFDIVSQ